MCSKNVQYCTFTVFSTITILLQYYYSTIICGQYNCSTITSVIVLQLLYYHFCDSTAIVLLYYNYMCTTITEISQYYHTAIAVLSLFYHNIIIQLIQYNHSFITVLLRYFDCIVICAILFRYIIQHYYSSFT